ncbi:2-succinyl-6-hydroxy-2,4-cyclohexadiene-1-carboxylate synthase [Xanthomonas hydrangeae]|uniref:alpha/beta hydrolase n=1 Tax=Xanthomonas hydrangeae TaxID=2775159 RepID=UPI00196452E6|nr:2-succinyl-6-hydroxy-2,4-cyclohexadiene-1-carboxylate synthase [Xanthomonas hydrangeae]CAD7713082.1 2-succinyl-6-hydroxy-2,4-cyclohexadiene-1-carboxylate synthase [Xanthomonas hydrangeae]CAD7718741.1 2-succinyl-6-hydroxy-2,4-cyclohexadiene-1-carboxylate synthase [Xanthomonas hydrangeae]CAD7718743.1 2-succinyl-6-hydroxy-2,4-cyclohexadiene-1-carboxylate synthase [Xanthomonas hydrangeae]
MTLRFVCLLMLLLATCALQAQPHPGPGTQLSQVGADDGQTLAVWSRVPAQPRGTILLVHGRTWSALPNFDLQVPGEARDSRSVLAALAQAGYAAYAVDLRGYGGSARDGSGWNTPTRAVADVREVLAWIARKHAHLPPPALLGYSNGARVALLIGQQHPQALSALVLYGFPDDVDAAPDATPPSAQPLRARTTVEAAGEDFITANAAPSGVRAAYAAQAVSADPVRTDWRAMEQFAFQPEQVATLPVLLLRGVDDPIATQPDNAHLYARLRSEDRSWVTLPHADHVAHVEDTHAAWVDAVVGFLRRPR